MQEMTGGKKDGWMDGCAGMALDGTRDENAFTASGQLKRLTRLRNLFPATPTQIL